MKPLFTDLTSLLPIAAVDGPSGFSLIWDFLAIGGFVMLFIVLCSMAAVTVMISAWLRLRDHLVLPASVAAHLRALPGYAAKGDIKPLQEFLERDQSLLARLGALAISGTFSSRQECVETITARAKEDLHHLERGVSVLEVMVTVAPLLGLLGTTAGLVGMFSAFGSEAGPDTATIAKEIGVALRCTIAGLFVAVPSVLAHTYFVRRLDNIAVRLESILHETIQTFFAHFEVKHTHDVRTPEPERLR
ncbi:biopolymer transport protein ExbB [Prosthecobacter fusiformis]|uniref:Biopolymer transport protein ExbB n=1 Tax=Prosthecobacter fusiformis TaxID=48464 RepID=A0A4R7SPD4_9BACT|nr:MotA/TolQ/ExbB proton channel family protein [Prosthecobacter fusiformis]TDU81062.1 biopolymer transport protein ExbB [Prosthecobacter fusiformis]